MGRRSGCSANKALAERTISAMRGPMNSKPRSTAISRPSCLYMVPTSARSASSKSGNDTAPGMCASANSPGDRASNNSAPFSRDPSRKSWTPTERLGTAIGSEGRLPLCLARCLFLLVRSQIQQHHDAIPISPCSFRGCGHDQPLLRPTHPGKAQCPRSCLGLPRRMRAT